MTVQFFGGLDRYDMIHRVDRGIWTDSRFDSFVAPILHYLASSQGFDDNDPCRCLVQIDIHLGQQANVHVARSQHRHHGQVAAVPTQGCMEMSWQPSITRKGPNPCATICSPQPLLYQTSIPKSLTWIVLHNLNLPLFHFIPDLFPCRKW